MKKTLLAASMTVLAMAEAAAADPAHGVWQTEPEDGVFAHVTLAACGNAVCGTITRAYTTAGAAYQSENIGRQIVIDMVPNGDGTYEGSVWRPSNDRIYSGRMTLNGNAITMRGCVAGGLICGRANWVRVQ